MKRNDPSVKIGMGIVAVIAVAFLLSMSNTYQTQSDFVKRTDRITGEFSITDFFMSLVQPEGPICGNGVCENWELITNCCVDCGCRGDYRCEGNKCCKDVQDAEASMFFDRVCLYTPY